jgi:hypothetical protein
MYNGEFASTDRVGFDKFFRTIRKEWEEELTARGESFEVLTS